MCSLVVHNCFPKCYESLFQIKDEDKETVKNLALNHRNMVRDLCIHIPLPVLPLKLSITHKIYSKTAIAQPQL